MIDHQLLLTTALQKSIEIVEGIEDRYRDTAFPIILKALIDTSVNPVTSSGSHQEVLNPLKASSIVQIQTSVNEFFHSVNPDTHPARFITAAYYYLHAEQKEQVSQADILEIYRKLRQPQPRNPTDVITQCIRKALMIDAPTKDKQKCWAITPAGEKFVESLMKEAQLGNNGNNQTAG